MALSITTDGEQEITDATGAAGVVYLSGADDGARVRLGVQMSNGETVELNGSNLLRGGNVVQHGTGVTLMAITRGAGGSTAFVLDYYAL